MLAYVAKLSKYDTEQIASTLKVSYPRHENSFFYITTQYFSHISISFSPLAVVSLAKDELLTRGKIFYSSPGKVEEAGTKRRRRKGGTIKGKQSQEAKMKWQKV